MGIASLAFIYYNYIKCKNVYKTLDFLGGVGYNKTIIKLKAMTKDGAVYLTFKRAFGWCEKVGWLNRLSPFSLCP
jgi:hypothetical protein